MCRPSESVSSVNMAQSVVSKQGTVSGFFFVSLGAEGWWLT